MPDAVLGPEYTTINERYKVVRLVMEILDKCTISNKQISYNNKCYTDSEMPSFNFDWVSFSKEVILILGRT